MKEMTKDKQPSVAIIIVNYNGIEDTIECIKSLNKINYCNYKAFVIENGSSKKPSKDQIDYLKEHAVYMESSENLGFSGGNNIGIRKALEMRFDYVLLLNNDTTVEPDFLNILIDAATEKTDVGIVGGKIAFYSNPSHLWYGGGYLNKKYGGGSHERWNELNPEDTGEIREVTFITGCLMLIPTEVMKKVGLLSEEYFLYAEDTDFCYKVIQAGYKLWFCENTLIYHKVSASTGATSAMTQYYMVRNVLHLTKKYRTDYHTVNARFTYQVIKDVIRGRKQFAPVRCAYRDYLKGNMGKWEI